MCDYLMLSLVDELVYRQDGAAKGSDIEILEEVKLAENGAHLRGIRIT
jgi:hypothetical protein